MNRHALDVLEFPAALDHVAGHAGSDLGAAAVRALEPSDALAWISPELGRVDEARGFLIRVEDWGLPVVPDLRAALRRLAVEGSVWDAPTLAEARTLLESGREARRVAERHAEDFPAIGAVARRMAPLEGLRDGIAGAVGDDGEVRDDASRELARVRREIRGARAGIVQALEQYMASLPTEVRVEDASVTVRDGRFVIPVRREGRKRVGGIVHAESASGATLFVEPPVAIELMNQLRSLESSEEREVQRILAELTDRVRPHADELAATLHALVELDSLCARGRYALRHNSGRPTMVAADRRDYNVVEGHHPLLLAGGDPVVPFDLAMDPGERTLVVSGPNTGGKTVLLKAMGLISAMAQSGIIPPVGEGVTLPVFSDIFADIGDEQSIEASLSTFSAHLRNLREILDQADEASLVLIDEIGSGTDPQEGGALAQAVLVELNRRGAMTVATSHLGQLKLLAGDVAGVANASLQFDPAVLQPTYRLVKGVPGRSYGLAIARRLEFPHGVLERAEALLPQSERDVAQLLAELEAKERELAQAVQETELARRETEAARREVESLRTGLEERQEAVKRRETDAERRARQQARDLLLQSRKEVEAAIEDLRQTVAASGDRELLEREATRARRRVEAAAERQAERAPESRAVEAEPGGVAPGMRVRIPATGATGRVVELRDGRASVESGGVRLDVPAASLERLEEPEPERKPGGVWTGPTPDAAPEIDLRGLRAVEVPGQLQPAIDAAIQADLQSLRIIHGKGTGALRDIVTELLDADRRVTSHRPGEIGEGGSGVTVAVLR